MNPREDQIWFGLLERSASTFAAEPTPPFGFVTSTLTRIRAEQGQVAEFERIGWRALLASFAALALAAVVTFSITYHNNRGTDFDPGVKSLIQMDNIQVS